jgi:hypothetical protein
VSDFGELENIKGSKEHRCEYCYGPIPKGEIHKQFKGKWHGEWQNWRMHEECSTSYQDYDDYDDGFMPGEGVMPERVKALLVKDELD